MAKKGKVGKQKTNASAKKRFKQIKVRILDAEGKFVRFALRYVRKMAGTGHLLLQKSKKQKRLSRNQVPVSVSDNNAVRGMLRA